MKSLLKNISKYKILTHNSTQSFSQSYAQTIVNKYIVTRTQKDKFSLYLDPDATVKQFKTKIQQIFPKSNIGVSSSIPQKLGIQVDQGKEKQINQKLNDILLIDALLLNRISVYEKNEKNQLQIIYGLQISQLNTTNRINIPEHIQEGIVQLNEELTTKQLTVANAFSFQNIPKFQYNQNVEGEQKTEASLLTKQQQAAFNESLGTLIKIKKFQKQILPFLPRTQKLMKRIVAMMSINWIFLFYLTYAKYGWDVGEPVSYLSGLGIDLAAIAGIFETNRALSNQKQSDKKAIQSRLNLPATAEMAKWRIAYLYRKTIL